MKHIDFKNGPPEVAMHAMREREIMGPKGREMLAGMMACSFESDISLCLLYLSHKCCHFCSRFTQMILPNHVLFGQKMTPLLVEIQITTCWVPHFCIRMHGHLWVRHFQSPQLLRMQRMKRTRSLLLLGKSLISTRFFNVLSSLNI